MQNFQSFYKPPKAPEELLQNSKDKYFLKIIINPQKILLQSPEENILKLQKSKKESPRKYCYNLRQVTTLSQKSAKQFSQYLLPKTPLKIIVEPKQRTISNLKKKHTKNKEH